VPWGKKNRAISLLNLWVVRPVQCLSICTTVHFSFTYTSNTLWAVQAVQNLSACTTVHFNFTYNSNPPMDRTACTEPQCLYNGALYLYLYLYLYFPYGPDSLYRASVPVQLCTLTLPIPLHPLWTVQHVQGLRASTKVHFNFTYTSTHPMGLTNCTEPQCLYKGAL